MDGLKYTNLDYQIKMKIKKMGRFLLWILPEDIEAITLYPFGMYYKTSPSLETINHEYIHWCQQKEMLCLFFYLWYITEWLLKIGLWGNQAYYHISFEQEAYINEDGNINNRKHYAWLKYVL